METYCKTIEEEAKNISKMQPTKNGKRKPIFVASLNILKAV